MDLVELMCSLWACSPNSRLIAIVSSLSLNAVEVPWAPRLAPLTTTAIGVLFVAAVIQVVALGWYNLRVMKGEAAARGGVVGDVRWGPR